MFARLLTLTKLYQLAATQVALHQRTVIRLSPDEWAELVADTEFAKVHDGKNHTEINGVVVTVQPVKVAVTSDTAAHANTPHG